MEMSWELVASVITVVTGVIAIIEFIAKPFYRKVKSKNAQIRYTNFTERWLDNSNSPQKKINNPVGATIVRTEKDENKLDNLSLNEWHINIRRKVICPFWATNVSTGSVGYVKRVMPLKDAGDDIEFQVTLENGDSDSYWYATDIYPIDRLSYNFYLLQKYRSSIDT